MLSIQEKEKIKGVEMKNLFHYRLFIQVAIIGVVLAFMASQMSEVYAEKKPKAPVEKTGQTVIVEAGDDGDLQKGVSWPNPRFKDNGDGTIKDELTKLIWDKDANRFGRRSLQQCAE